MQRVRQPPTHARGGSEGQKSRFSRVQQPLNGVIVDGMGHVLTQCCPELRITVMSWKGLLAALLLASLTSPTPADEVESTPGLSDHLTPPLVQRLRELVAPATDKGYDKCLATLAPPALCECMTRRIPLRFDWLCEVTMINEAGSAIRQNVLPLATSF
jgi:hypothetical protein